MTTTTVTRYFVASQVRKACQGFTAACETDEEVEDFLQSAGDGDYLTREISEGEFNLINDMLDQDYERMVAMGNHDYEQENDCEY